METVWTDEVNRKVGNIGTSYELLWQFFFVVPYVIVSLRPHKCGRLWRMCCASAKSWTHDLSHVSPAFYH